MYHKLQRLQIRNKIYLLKICNSVFYTREIYEI